MRMLRLTWRVLETRSIRLVRLCSTLPVRDWGGSSPGLLDWLRSNGINIVGTASHGSNYCKVYHYLNYYFFEECTLPVAPNFDNNIAVPKDGKLITLIKGKLSDFDLQYEAYFLNNNKYLSLIHISEPTRLGMISYAVFCLKKKKTK